MKSTIARVAALALLAGPAIAGTEGALEGDYVEARTAEVFAGGCVMGSEAETVGREAVLAWRVTRGGYQGVPLDGLSVVAVLAGERNLGIHELGGEVPGLVQAAILVDDRASSAQRAALVELAREMTRGLAPRIVQIRDVSVRFDRTADRITVAAETAQLDVQTTITHDPSCGAMQWFQPLAPVTEAAVGLTSSQAYQGTALGTRWRQAGKRSAFFGRFALDRPTAHPPTAHAAKSGR